MVETTFISVCFLHQNIVSSPSQGHRILNVSLLCTCFLDSCGYLKVNLSLNHSQESEFY